MLKSECPVLDLATLERVDQLHDLVKCVDAPGSPRKTTQVRRRRRDSVRHRLSRNHIFIRWHE